MMTLVEKRATPSIRVEVDLSEFVKIGDVEMVKNVGAWVVEIGNDH